MSPAWTQEQLLMLRQAREEYLAQTRVEHYDQVLHEVSARAAAAGELGKADIGALLFWKRLRADTIWVARLHLFPDAQVRRITRGARDAMRADGRHRPQRPLGAVGAVGFAIGDAPASAVLFALAPHRMAIYDRRAHAALHQLGLHLDNRRGRYSRYIELLESLAESLSSSGPAWSARDVDLALYWLGAQRTAEPRLQSSVGRSVVPAGPPKPNRPRLTVP